MSKSHYLELSYRQRRPLNRVILMVGTLPHHARKCTKAERESDGHILFTNMPGKVVLESQNLVTICFYHSVNKYTPFSPARIH